MVHGLRHTRLLCPPQSPGVCSNSCPWKWWLYLTISSSVTPFSFCLQSYPALGSFPMSHLFTSGGQSIGVSASTSVLPMNTQDWSPLGWTGWISLQSKGLSRVFSNTAVQKELNTLPLSPNSQFSEWSLSVHFSLCPPTVLVAGRRAQMASHPHPHHPSSASFESSSHPLPQG